MVRRLLLVLLLVAPPLLAGCAGNAAKNDRPATSLVYSPAPSLQAEGEQGRTREAASGRVGQAPSGLRTGVPCRVHLRRDAMGLAGQGPLPIVGTTMISERALVGGTIERVEADAVLLRANNSTYWIPREAILAVEFPDERQP